MNTIGTTFTFSLELSFPPLFDATKTLTYLGLMHVALLYPGGGYPQRC